MIEGIIFDFDGTILDSELPEFQTWQEIYLAHGHELDLTLWARGIGTISGFDPYAHLESLSGRKLDRPGLRQRRNERFRELTAHATLQPGVENWLRMARQLGLKIGLASSSTHEWVETHLKQFDIFTYFDTIKCSDDVEWVKPDPALYRAALSALNLTARQAIAIEDSPNGVAAAKGAGLFCVAVPNELTGYLDLSQADLRLNSLAEVADLQKWLRNLSTR